MATIEIPTKQVEVCDFCQREGYVQNCDCCEKQYCLIHEGKIAGSYGFTNVCIKCADRKEVKSICADAAEKLRPIHQQRRTDLKALRLSPPNKDSAA